MVRSGNNTRYASANAHAARGTGRGFTETFNTAAAFVCSFLYGVWMRAAHAMSRAAALGGRLFKGTAAVFIFAHAKCKKNPLLFIALCARGFAAAFRRHRSFAGSLALTAAPIAAAALLGGTVFFWSGATFALEIRSGGLHIGYVTSETVFETAKSRLIGRLLSGEEACVAINPTYSLALVSRDDLVPAGALVDKMLSTAAFDLTEAAGLYVDGSLLAACPGKSDIDGILKSYLASAGAQSGGTAEFYSQVEIETGLYVTDSVISPDALREEILGGGHCPISVKIKKTETSVKEIAFPTVEVKDDSKDTSYRRVTNAGKLGKAEITEEVIYIDGVESQRMVEDTKILVKPVEKKIVIGTAETPKALVAAGDGVATGTFAWPVEKVPRMYVSAYWGDGRGHKAIDIAAPKGTLIYAADGGTVLSVKTDSRYGKYFVVDHGNNIRTLYAHCSEINVEAGQKVTRGQAVAKVGSTGNSTGPHLHIEVHLNDVRVNPAPYLGIK